MASSPSWGRVWRFDQHDDSQASFTATEAKLKFAALAAAPAVCDGDRCSYRLRMADGFGCALGVVDPTRYSGTHHPGHTGCDAGAVARCDGVRFVGPSWAPPVPRDGTGVAPPVLFRRGDVVVVVVDMATRLVGIGLESPLSGCVMTFHILASIPNDVASVALTVSQFTQEATVALLEAMPDVAPAMWSVCLVGVTGSPHASASSYRHPVLAPVVSYKTDVAFRNAAAKGQEALRELDGEVSK